MKRIFAFALFAAFALELLSYEIYSDFPGGNIKVVEKTGNKATITQDYRDSDWWFYWNFGVRGAEGKTIIFNFVNSGDIIGFRGPAASFDGGHTWKWLGSDGVKRRKSASSFEFSFPKDAKDVRFAFCIPYMPTDFDAFIKKAPAIKKHFLGKTKKGRENYYYTLGNPDGKLKIFLTSRHHACESTGTYAMQGILEEFLKNSTPACALLKDAEIIAVPFMDLDGVLDGDQGKYRKPHDHNRDYSDSPIYPSVAAFQKLYNKKAGESQKTVLIDLHAPFIYKGVEGDKDNRTYVVEPQFKDNLSNLRKFSGILEKKTLASGKSSLKHLQKWDYKFGASNNNAGDKKDRTVTTWSSKHPKSVFSASIEIPYTDNQGVEVTPENLRGLGADIAGALAEYFGQ